ncbi:MAG: ABC transporter ATP-binding protein [Thermotogae bacterium]|nr:ABC transporter ATP-binding protein [Thermotogota bacterium]HOO74678.1 ABC transporter ATP-binding protein [Tepiditoga sp.]
MIKISNVNKKFNSKPILNNVNLDIKSGEVFALIGPNGAGKTTLLRCIYDDLIPDSGEILFNGERLSSKIKEKIAVMNEDRLIFKNFAGEDYLKVWKLLYPDFSEETFNDFILHYKFDLKQKVNTFSMGMRALLHLALVVSSGADLIILDEPTQNLDPVIRFDILNIIKNIINDSNKTVLISSHEIMELEEIATSFAIIREGKILYSDNIDDAKENHRVIDKGVKIPYGDAIGFLSEEILVKCNEEVGRYPTFKELTIGYLNNTQMFNPLKKDSKGIFDFKNPGNETDGK